ncbi:hypothetical protein [uncultured Oscillibacter sp.]|uniref:hypothetical protein n=1 Tax=uncultured Oscillibacter sp. TaxID=876091 RepID=UPI00262B67B4|nr:hypothetical protein [uncultured Oscillibacter sp.]
MKTELSPAELLFAEQNMAEPRKKEAARRIIEISGELHISISELERVMEYVKHYAGLILLD